MKMSDEDYLMTQQQLLAFAGAVRHMDLKGFIQRIGEAETVGSMLDPTSYMKAQGNLQILKDLANGLWKFQNSLPAIEEVERAERQARQ